jgi:hypothetical protein
MSAAVDAAMTAIEKALRKPLIARLMIRLGVRPPRRIASENRWALRVIRRHMAGHAVETDDLESALHTVALRIKTDLRPSPWSALLDDYEFPSVVDDAEAEHARSLIMRGQIEECLIHLERALPAEYAVIAERLAHHFRSRP